MELHTVHKTSHHSHLGEEKHQMLNLNRRLETYLSRVKLLEEENVLLSKEIQALRCSHHGALTHRKGLEEELRRARLELDAAWRDRVHAELEVGRLTEEFQALDLQRQREAQAHVKAKTTLEQSRKELEEEQRAQIWLREKVSQLEHEMRFLIQSHQEDVAHLEATLTHSRATVPPTLAQRGNETPNLLQLGQEYSQRATRAWQEAAETYEGQLAQLEGTLNQARSHLTQVGQEKSESQLRLQALEREIASAQDVRLHLEKNAAQKRDKHSQEIQQLQTHVGGMEAEKEELSQQINHLLMENRSLLQLKMSLGLEVATYRALLDSESLRGDNSLFNQPRNVSITDAAFCLRGVKKNYQTQQSARHKTASLSPLRVITGTAATPLCSRRPVTFSETPKNSKPADAEVTKSATWEIPYPKILQDGAVENFRPQEVQEKVTYAEPLSPPNEQEASAPETSGDKEVEEEWKSVDDETPEETVVQSVVSYQTESEVSHHQFTTPNLTPYYVREKEKACVISDESDKDVTSEGPAENEDVQPPLSPADAWGKKEGIGNIVEHVQEETSDSETEAVLEPALESGTSSPVSVCEPGESVFNQLTDFSRDENSSKDGAAETRQEINNKSTTGTNETDVEYKLYPDGEEMDTWDSVIERKVDLTDNGKQKDEAIRQHAEPEEDISARELEHKKREISQDFATDTQEDDNVASAVMDTKVDDDEQQAVVHQDNAPPPHKDEEDDDDEEEDSQNVCVSWRTELESDSYAQDNTLADTRPLIRYRSDETDANTQASHMDESESSEGDQEKKIGEAGSGMWSDDKSKRFGTMEDLCEEAEGEALDEEYDLGYTHTEDKDVDYSMTVSEHATSGNNTEHAEGMIETVSEEYSDEETEEFTKPVVPTNVDYDEELETDRLVEQELEHLSTDVYSAHFAQQQLTDSGEVSVQDMSGQEEAGQTKTDDTSFCAESGAKVNSKPASSSTVIDQHYESLYFSDSSVVLPQTDTLGDDEEDQHKDREAATAPEKTDEDDVHNESMVTHADVMEDRSGFSDFIYRPDTEEINNSEDPSSAAPQEKLQDAAAAPTEAKEAVPVEVSESQEHPVNEAADCQSFPDLPETAEWEVVESPSEDFESSDQNESEQKCDGVPDSAESHLHDDEGADQGLMTCKEEPLEISPDYVPNENDIFVVKDSTVELLKTNGKDSGHHGVFSSGTKNDFWVSSLESGATYQPDGACNEAAEQTNQNLGFGDNLVWGNSANSNVVNGNSRVDADSPKALAARKAQEQIHLEVKQVLCRNAVEGELVHSEESEAEGESWSSGEEPV
ncbi:nestin [Toxotes jaculatrix]|uniref:nestin n=1 Tax=Toxotes jaculatrix TaxID=941984 RepID=UPI001B3A93B7|nr:nestin [Toxotes jaculatrix]